MAQQVDVKGFGLVEFPDGISRETMLQALQRRFSQMPANESGATVAPYTPSLSEKAASGVSNVLQRTGLISNQYQANRIGGNVETALNFLPVVGDAIGGDELGRAIAQGDAGDIGFAALGAIPVVGDLAKGMKGMSFKDKMAFVREKINSDYISKIIEKAETDGFNEFGLRVLSKNPKTGSQDRLSVGDYLPESFDWVDGAATDTSLGGTSTVGIDWDGWDVLNLDEKIKILNQYLPMGDEVVLVGGRTGRSFEGNDVGERVIPDAVVLDVIR